MARNDANETVKKEEWNLYSWFESDLSKLKDLYFENKLPQVIVFYGPQGIGKKDFLLQLLGEIYCKDHSACGTCDGCSSLRYGSHDEVFWLEGKSLKVEAARELQEHVSFISNTPDPQRPSMNLPRIAVVNEAETLTVQAANRLLKTLEEPAENTHIFLTCSRIGLLLDTILSRAIKWRLRGPSEDVGLSWLRNKLEADKLELDDRVLKSYLKMADSAPLEAHRKIVDKGHEFEDVERLFRDILFNTSKAATIDAAEKIIKEYKLSSIDVVERVEVFLNQYYRWLLLGEQSANSTYFEKYKSAFSPLELKQRRKVLSDVKNIVGKGKVPLNAQLVVEALGVKERRI